MSWIREAEKDACRAFPDPQRNDLATGPKRNFQILDPLDFIAEFTQHVPPKGSHLIRYYGYYSNKARGMRRKAAAAILPSPALGRGAGGEGINDHSPAPRRASQTWAMLIKRVYEIDPLECPVCGGQMTVIAFIEPPQGAVIEKILRHCGLWQPSTPRAPPAGIGWVHAPDDEPLELTYVDADIFEATF